MSTLFLDFFYFCAANFSVTFFGSHCGSTLVADDLFFQRVRRRELHLAPYKRHKPHGHILAVKVAVKAENKSLTAKTYAVKGRSLPNIGNARIAHPVYIRYGSIYAEFRSNKPVGQILIYRRRAEKPAPVIARKHGRRKTERISEHLVCATVTHPLTFTFIPNLEHSVFSDSTSPSPFLPKV